MKYLKKYEMFHFINMKQFADIVVPIGDILQVLGSVECKIQDKYATIDEIYMKDTEWESKREILLSYPQQYNTRIVNKIFIKYGSSVYSLNQLPDNKIKIIHDYLMDNYDYILSGKDMGLFESVSNESREYKIDFIKKVINKLDPDQIINGNRYYNINKTFNHDIEKIIWDDGPNIIEEETFTIKYIQKKLDVNAIIVSWDIGNSRAGFYRQDYDHLIDCEDFILEQVYEFYKDMVGDLDLDEFGTGKDMGLL